MSDWKPYIGDRLKLDHPAGFVIIVPQNREPPVPIFCPVCRLLMQSADDAEYFRTKACCQKCGMKWADQDKERWMSGWRPESFEIKAEVMFRQSIPLSLNVDSLDG